MMASEELRNAIDTFDYRQYLRYKGLSEDEIPETLSDEKKQALFRRAHEDAYEDMVKAYKADPFMDVDAAKDKAREDLLKGRDYLRPLFGLWEKQQTADEIYKPEAVLTEALRQSGVDITDPNFSIENLPDSIRYKELTPYIEQYANAIVNDNLKYNAPELAGVNKKTFIDNFRNVNGLSSLDTINDLFAQIAKRNAEQAREERVARGEIERGWVDKVFGTDGWINAALGVGTAGGAGMLGNSAVIAGNQGQRALEWAEENPLHVAFGPLAWAASKVPGLSSVVDAGNEWLSQYTKGDVNYLRPEANSWARRKLMEFERWGMRTTNEAARVRDSMNYVPKFDRFLEDYAKDWDFGGFTGRILEQAASNWPSVAQNLVVPALGAGVGAMLAGPLGAGAGALWGYGLTTGGSLLVGAPMSAGDALADLADHGVYDTFEQEKYLPYVTAAVTLDYISTLALHTGFSGFVGRGVNAGIGSLFTSRAEREAAKKALQQAAAAQGMNWNTIQSVAGRQLLKVRAAELAGASTKLGKAMGKVAGPVSSFLEEMYTETAQEDIAMQLLNYATSQASQGQGAWESLGEMGKKFLEGGVNPRNWSPVPFWGRESMFAQYEDGAKYSPRMYNERLLSAGLVGGLMGGGTHIGMNTFRAVSDKLNGRNRKQDASVIATDEKGNTALMLARNTERSLAEKMFATMQAKGLGVNAQTVVGVDLQNVGGAYTANFNGVTGVGEDATKAFMDLSYRANLNRQNIDSNTITENNGGWEATLANNEKLRVVGTNAEQILRDIVNIHNSDNHPLVINRGATIEYNPNNAKPWKITQSNGITVRAETLYDNYALYDFSTNASGNLIVDSVIRRKGKQDVEHGIGLNLTQTGDITFTDQFQNIQNAVANSNGRLVLLDATESKRGTRNPRVRVNGSVTNNTMRILDVESGVIYTVKLSKGRRNSSAHVNVTATTLDGRKLRLDANVAKQTLRSAANPSALNNNIRLATPSTGITIQGETLAGQTGYHFNAAQIAEITKRTGAQIMAQTSNHLELSLPTWIDGRETMTSLTLDIDDAGKVWASANGQTIEIEGINDRYVGDFANETAGRILAETADSLQIHALTGGEFRLVGTPDPSTGALTMRRTTAAGSTIEVTLDRRGKITNFRVVDDPSLDLQQRIDEGITHRNQRTQAQQAQQANLGQIVDPDLKAFTEDELRQLSIDPATINAELKANFNNAIGQMLRSANTFAEIEAGLESMGFLPGRFLYQDFLNGGHWVLRDKDGNVIGQYADDATGLRDLKNMSYGRIETAFGTNNVIPYVLEQFVDGIQNRGYTNDITNITRDDYAKAVAKYLSYYDAVFGPEVETVVPSIERDTLVRQRLQQRWQDIYDGRVLLTTLEDVLKFYGDYIQVGWRLFDKVGGTHVNSNHVAVEDTDSSAFLTDVQASTVQKSQNIGLVRAYMIGDRIYAQDQILKAAHQKNNLNMIQYDQMENLAQQELQKYTESPSVRARRGERRYIDRLNQFIRESVTPLLSMTNLDDIIEHYENLGGRVETYKTYYDLSTGTYIGKDGQKYSRVDISTSDIVRQVTRWEGTSKPTNANINEGEQGFILYRPDGMEIFSIEGLAMDNTVVDNFVETLKRADTMMSFLDTVEVNDQINDLLVQDAQEEETPVLTEQEAETQINGELFNQAQSAQNGFDFIELYRGQLQKRYVVRDLDSGLYKSRSVDSVDLNVDNFFHEDEVRNLALPTNYDIVGYWVLFHSGEQTVETFDTDENFDIFADRLRNQDMLDVINKTELINQRVEDSRIAAGQQNARKETLRRQREAVAAQAQAAAQAASQPNVNPASAPNSIPYADYLTRMFGNEALVSLSNKVMLGSMEELGWRVRDMLYEKRKKKGEFGNRNVNDPKQSLDTEIRGTFASKLWRSALRRKLVRTYKTNDEYFASHQTIADKILLQRARAEIANQRKAELTTVSSADVEVLNYLSALTDEQKKTILAEAGLQGRYNKAEGVIELIEENIPNEMGVSVFFHELAVHGTAHLTKDLAVAWQRVAEFLRTQSQGTVVNGQRQINEIGAAVRDIIRNRQIDFTDDKWGYWEEVSAYFVADNLNKLSFAQNIKALFRRWFRQTGIVAPGEDITVQDILYFAKSAAKIGISRANDWKSANFGKTMGDAFSLMGTVYHKSETIIAQQYEGIRQHYEQNRNLEMMGTTYDRATGLGQYSNLNDAHWLLVRTPFYKQWFGDWENNPSRASKVVDSNGEPLLVPHGRKHDRIAYDLPFTGFNGNFGYSGQYTYSQIEENPHLDRFSGSGIAQVFLNVRKPLHAHNYQHMSETMRRLGFQESTRRLDLRAMLPDMVNEDARAVIDGIMRYSEDGNPRGSFSDFLILNDDLLASVFPNADIRESHRFVTGLFEAATTPSGSILVEEPVLGVTSTEEYARSLGEAERAHMDRAATIFDQYLEGFENQMVRLSYNPDGYFTAFRETHDDISMSTRETITDVMGAIDQRAQEYGETDMVAFKDAVVQAYNEIQTLEESELSNDEAFLNVLNLALHKLRVEEVAVRLGVDLKTVPAYPTMPTRAMLKEGNIQLAERVRGEMLRQGFDGLWGTDDILLLHPDQAHDASEFTDLYADVSVNRTQGITTTPYEQSIMEAADDNLVSDAERLGVSSVRLRSEYRSIYQAFAPSAPWIKSNLDEYNWILTRTPSFKENFGDWQNDATEDMWLDWRGEPVRTPQGFISTETIQTEEGYFSTIGPSAFQRMQGTQTYSQAIDEVALESLYGIGELTEEGTRIQEELVNLQKQDSDLLKRIAAIQAQIARAQVSVPDEEARRRQASGEPVSVEPDENLVRERDALYERVDNIGRYIDELQSTITEDVTPERAEEIRTRLSEISAREQEIGERFINRTLTRRDVSLNELRSLSERYNRLRSRLEKLRNEYIEIEAVDNVIENIRLRISQLNDAIDASTARAEEIGTAQNRLNELNAQRNRAILEREKVLSKIFGLNERMLSVLTSELRAERERILFSPDTISTREGTVISPDEFRRLTDIEDLLAPMTSIVDEQRPYNEMMARLSKLREERDYRNAQIERLNGEIETILDNESFEDEGERTLATLIRERDQRMREIAEVEEQVYNEYGSRTGVSERVAFLENRIRTIEERLGQLGEKIDTLAERRLLENEEYAETVIQEQSEQEEEVRRLLQERRVLTAELNNYGIQSSITSLTRLKEELLGQISRLNENILSQMERQRRRMTAPTRRRMRNIERIIRKQGEIQTKNDEALSELNDVMDELNDVRERLRTSGTRILNERLRAQLLLGAERMENEKWEFIDEMAGMMERVAIRIGETNRLVRDNPGMSQAALNAVNARKAGLVAELDRLRNQWTNGAAKMDDDIIVARDHAQRLAQRDPNIEQIINDLETRRDTLVAQIDETNGELDYLDERLLNLSGVAGEVTIAMKDNLLEQLDRLNSERENIQNRINELSERKSITQQAIEQRNATIAAMERVDAYVLAQQLEAAGQSAEQIKLVTGFERDKEGNWGYSLSNRDATFVDPIFIIEERLKELYKKAGLRMKPKNKASFNELRQLLDQYHRLYREKARGLDIFKQNEMVELSELINRKVAGFINWISGREKDRITDALRKRGIMDNVEDIIYAPVKLSEMFNDEALFTAYPELNNTVVEIYMDKGSTTLGAKVTGENRFRFNVAHLRLHTDYMEALVHKIQHQIQEWENWTPGARGNTSTAQAMREYLRNYGEFGARYAGRNWAMSQEQLRAYSQDKFLDDDNAYWNEWFERIFNESMTPIRSDEFIFSSTGQVQNVSNYDLGYFSTTAPVAKTNWKSPSELDNEEYITLYRAVVVRDGKYYSPMAEILAGNPRPIELGKWEYSVEHPELIVTEKGKEKFRLIKKDGGTVSADYAPYIHSSLSPLNDQFTTAYRRPVAVLEIRVPKSEVSSGYRAEKAKKSVGWSKWRSGPVASKLGNVREVMLSRYAKPVRALSDTQVAERIKEINPELFVKGKKAIPIPIPINVVTPGLLQELVRLGATVGEPSGFKTQYPAQAAEKKRLSELTADIRKNGVNSSYFGSVGQREQLVAPHGTQKQANAQYPSAREELLDEYFSLAPKRRERYRQELLTSKRPDLTDQFIEAVLNEVDTYGKDVDKEAAVIHWTIKGTIVPYDDRDIIDKAREISKITKMSREKLLSYDSPVSLVGEYYRDQLKPTGSPINPDDVPELSDPIDHGDGIISYNVQDDKQGQEAMRRIVNTHFGSNWSGWCLLAARRGGQELTEHSWDMWKYYNASTKRAAFKNGTLVGFMAVGPDYVDNNPADIIDNIKDSVISELTHPGKEHMRLFLEGKKEKYVLTEQDESTLYESYFIGRRIYGISEIATKLHQFHSTLIAGGDIRNNRNKVRIGDIVGRIREIIETDAFGLGLSNLLPKSLENVIDEFQTLENLIREADEYNRIMVHNYIDEYMDVLGLDKEPLVDWINFIQRLETALRDRGVELYREVNKIAERQVRVKDLGDGTAIIADGKGNAIDLYNYGYNIDNIFRISKDGKILPLHEETHWYDKSDTMHYNLDWARNDKELLRIEMRSKGQVNQEGLFPAPPDEINLFSMTGSTYGRTSNYNLDIYDREEIQGSGGAYKLKDGRIFIDPDEVDNDDVARVMLYALVRENPNVMANGSIAEAVAIIRDWENSTDNEWRSMYNRIRTRMDAVHAPDSAILAYAVRQFMSEGISALNPTSENSPQGVFAAILREIPGIMGQAAGVSTTQVSAMPSDVITVTNALSGINNDTIDIAVPSLNMDQRTFEALETKANAPAFMETVMQDVKGLLDEYDNTEFQFINGVPHIRMGDLVLNLGTDPIFARNIVDQLVQNTVDMGNHDLTDRQNPGEEEKGPGSMFGDLAKRLPENAQLLGNARQEDVERFIKDNIPAYIADRIRIFYEETDESKAIFGEEYNGRFKPLMADREVIFIKAYGNRSLADVVGTTVKLVSMFGWTMWNNADFIPLMNELYTVLEHNIKTELPSYYAKIRGNTPTSSEKAALISAYLAAKSTSIYELTEFAGTSNVATTQEQKLIELGEKLKNEIGKVSLHMAESFASDFSQNEELVKEYTEKLLRLTMAPFHGQGVWLAYDLDYDKVRQTNPDAALALQKWENLSRVTVFANDFGPTYMAEPVTDTAISNAEMLRKFRNASPFMQKVWRFYWRNWHPPQKGIGDTILGTENSVMLGRAFNAVTEDMGLSMRNIFANVKQFQEELLRIGIESEEFDGKKGYEQELRDRGVTNEKLLDKAMIVDSFLRFGRQRMLENVIEIRRLITANAQKVDDYMRREGVSEKKIQEMHAEMNAFANRFISDWEHRSYRAYTDQGQEDLTEMYRILDGTKGRSDFKSMIDGIKDEINRLEQKKTSGQIKERAYGRERKKLRHRLNIYERLDALYHWSNQSVMSRLPSRPTQAQAANVPVDTVAAMKKEIERVRTLVAAEKARGVGGRMDLIPAVRKRKLNENNPHDVLYMKFLDQVKDPAIAMLYNLDQQGKIMDKLIFNTRFGESIIKTGMGTMKGTPDTKGLKVNNLSWMENGTFLRYVQIDPFFLDEIANEMEIQDKLKEGILGNVINLIKQNMTVLNWRMSISNWIGNLSNLIATGQIFRFSNWTKAFGMNKDKLAKQFLTDFRKSVDSLSKKDVENAVDSATKEYNEAVAMYQHEMNKLNIWGSGLTTAQIDAYGQGGWEKVTDLLGMTLQSISEKTKSDFFDDVSAERMRRKVGDWMRYAREFYGFGDEWVKPLTYINNRAVAMAKYRAMHNWSRFEGHENSQDAIRLDEQITNQAIREAALLTLKETTTWELSPDFARKITRSAARVVAPDFLLHQFQMLRIMAVNTRRWLECADEVGRLNAKGKADWTADEKVYYALVRGELVRRTVGQTMMASIFATMYTSAFSLSGYLVNLAAGALAGSGDDLEKKRRGQRKADDAPGMDWEEFRATSKLCNVASMMSDLYSPVMWVPGKVGKEFIAYNDQRVNAAYTMAQVRPPSVNPTAMERLSNMAMTLINMGGDPLTVQLVNLWHGRNSFGQNITKTEALWETLSLLTPQVFHQGYHVVQGVDRAMLGTEDLGWREKKKHRELSGFDIGGVKVKRISVDDMIENTGRKVKQLTSNENTNRRVFLDKLQRNPDMSDREIKLAVNEILTSNRLEMDKLNYAMSAFRELGIDRKRLVTRLTTGRNTTSPILGINRANQLVEGRDVLTLILLTNLTERIKSIEGSPDPDTDFLPDERRKVLRNLITARRMIQEADK